MTSNKWLELAASSKLPLRVPGHHWAPPDAAIFTNRSQPAAHLDMRCRFTTWLMRNGQIDTHPKNAVDNPPAKYEPQMHCSTRKYHDKVGEVDFRTRT